MDPTASLPVGQLQLAMALATRGIEQPQYLTVHAVHGLEAGIYRWPDLFTPIRVGDLREQTARICLDQGLGADAAYVVFSCANVSALDLTRATCGLIVGPVGIGAGQGLEE
jgi:hypothetical protein